VLIKNFIYIGLLSISFVFEKLLLLLLSNLLSAKTPFRKFCFSSLRKFLYFATQFTDDWLLLNALKA